MQYKYFNCVYYSILLVEGFTTAGALKKSSVLSQRPSDTHNTVHTI